MGVIDNPTWRGRPIPLTRDAIENEIERLIDLLDVVDPDPDLEPYLAGFDWQGDDREGDLDAPGYPGLSEGDDNPDDEPSLGWNLYGEMGPTFDPDLELDDSDREPNGDETDTNFTEDECGVSIWR